MSAFSSRVSFGLRLFALAGLLPLSPLFGQLDSPAPPGNPASAMYTLEDIYQRLRTGAAGMLRTGGFVEPTTGPGMTGHTLTEIMGVAPLVDDAAGLGAAQCVAGKKYWSLLSASWGVKMCTGAEVPGTGYPAPVEKTGQTTCWDAGGHAIACVGTGQDGDKRAGVASPSPRFTDNGDGTVTDELTGLIWLKNANCFGRQGWPNALVKANGLFDGSTNSSVGDDCGLTDGSSAGDWRLSNVKELQSLIDFAKFGPALPTGHPFSGVPASEFDSTSYWSSTSTAPYPTLAWLVNLASGAVHSTYKSSTIFVWPVRGGGQ